MPNWPMVALGEIAPLQRRPVQIEPEQEYHEIGARAFGRGLFDKPSFKGAELTWEKLFRIEEGDLVFSNIKAWEGAFAIARKGQHGKVASHRYLTCVPDIRRVLGEFLFQYLRTPAGIEQIGAISPGSADRNRTLNTKGLAAVRVPLPPIEEQRRIVERLDAVSTRLRLRAEAAERQQAELAATLHASFAQMIVGAPRVPMAELAPLVRRPVIVVPDRSYDELGVRSFGKGTFHKPALRGLGLGNKRIFRIEPGDLIFSNVFAWEGAIAIARPEDAGRVGSHRFITCVVDQRRIAAEILRFFFLTREGLGLIGQASPGGAGRNRTLGLEALGSIRAPVPPLDAQRWFNNLHAKVAEVRTHQAAIAGDANGLLPAMLAQIFG